MLNTIRWSIALKLIKKAKEAMEFNTFEGMRKCFYWWKLSLLVLPHDKDGCEIRKVLREQLEATISKGSES